jgi:hypothetical protein
MLLQKLERFCFAISYGKSSHCAIEKLKCLPKLPQSMPGCCDEASPNEFSGILHPLDEMSLTDVFRPLIKYRPRGSSSDALCEWLRHYDALSSPCRDANVPCRLLLCEMDHLMDFTPPHLLEQKWFETGLLCKH